MSKPTEQELQVALQQAKQMREQGEDGHFIAKSLLNCHYQNQYLFEVFQAAEAYLRSGLGTREHTRLVKAVEEARIADDYSAHVTRNPLGL